MFNLWKPLVPEGMTGTWAPVKTDTELAWYFNAQPSAWGGGPASVGRARYSYAKPYFISAAATVRAVANMANTGIEMSAVIPGGQAGHPSSEHYADQFQGWLNGELFPITSTPERVTGETITLLP